jgi:uncharacterized protein (DUF433 family)
VLKPDLPPIDGRRALSFLDLIDLLVVGRFREAGVPLQSVRKAYSWLARVLETDHPFAHARLSTDGQRVFMQMIEAGRSAGDATEADRLIEAVSGQSAMPEVLRPYLTRVEYGAITQRAARWHIADGVVLDPEVAFGKPTVELAGTSTFVLAASYMANANDAALVADLFDVPAAAVLHAVSFEEQFAAPRAA